jgi:sodium transport system permease protein
MPQGEHLIMNKLMAVAKKELHRFFKDWRMVIIALVFPGVMLYLLYAIVVPNIFSLLSDTDSQTVIYAVHPSETVNAILSSLEMELTSVGEHEAEAIKESIADKTNALLIIFPSDFDARLAALPDGGETPEIHIYYNSMTSGIAEQYGILIMVLNEWKSGIVNLFDVNRTGGGDLAANQDRTGFLLSMLLPVFILLFIFYGAMAIVVGTITGEKEKGTLAAILIVPMSTREFAAGKVLALGFETFLCGISGLLGILFSLPRLVKSMNTVMSSMQSPDTEFVIDISYFALHDYLFLLLILLSAAYLIVTLVCIISVLARTVREAQMLLSPVILAVITISLLGTVYGSGGINVWYYCIIPFYNTIQLLSGMFSRNFSLVYMLLTVLSNILYSIAGTEILSRLFKSEKIMIAK